MAKKKEEEFNLDEEVLNESVQQQTPVVQVQEPPKRGKIKTVERTDTENYVNPLRKEIITVKFLPQPGTINDPKHVLYGGLSERSFINITVPRLRSGTLVNVLTDSEKQYLEAIMGLEEGALNIYNKVDNFWSSSTEGGISSVRLTKEDTRLDLSNPLDYIKYKILLANKDLIAPDLQTLQDKPKATYKFVLISDNTSNVVAKTKLDVKMQSYFEFGKIQNNYDVLKAVIELITSKPIAKNTKLEFLQTKAGDLLDADPKLFLNVVKDPLLETKILIKKSVDAGFISKRGDYYYLRSDNSPLCESGEDPTLSVAAKFLNNPKRQEIKFSLETKLSQ